MRRLPCVLALALAGCAGSSYVVELDEAEYPVSMSGFLLDEEGAFVGEEALSETGTFQFSSRRSALLWGALPLGSDRLSEQLNRAVAASGGEAVTHLSVKASRPAVPDAFPGLLISLIPILPYSVDIEIEGKIVRRKGIGP